MTGCIGAYKSALILRLLQKVGFEVLPVMTRHAKEFITSLTLEKLSGQRVLLDLFAENPADQIEHITVARQSSMLLVAPATANTLAKFAHGIADDFLSTLYLSTTTPVVVAPAMNVEMWRHPVTTENLRLLRQRGVVIVEPESGYLACGETGEGRLAEPEVIVQTVVSCLGSGKSLMGKHVLVTAGPTVEDIDMVRFVSNRSSGKMGYAVAQEAYLRGAHVTLISGPTQIPVPEGLEVIRVRSALEMREAVFKCFDNTEIVVMAAAVSDFSPETMIPAKVKKRNEKSVIHLNRTTDILMELGKRKKRQFLVGFSAESGELGSNARRKLQKKNLDLIVANDISRNDRGFQSDYNEVLFIDCQGKQERSPFLLKSKIAELLWNKIENELPISIVRKRAVIKT